jgi:hypothetical protein
MCQKIIQIYIPKYFDIDQDQMHYMFHIRRNFYRLK